MTTQTIKLATTLLLDKYNMEDIFDIQGNIYYTPENERTFDFSIYDNTTALFAIADIAMGEVEHIYFDRDRFSSLMNMANNFPADEVKVFHITYFINEDNGVIKAYILDLNEMDGDIEWCYCEEQKLIFNNIATKKTVVGKVNLEDVSIFKL